MGATDELDPGNENFSFGVDVNLDRKSVSVASGSFDNGNNLIQRGLFTDRSQYKLDADNGRAHCRISGSTGTTDLTVGDLEPGVWYRLGCTRTGDVVKLSVTNLRDDTTVFKKGSGETGDLTPDDPELPLSVGGSLPAEGPLAADNDQLNGLAQDAFLSVGHRIDLTTPIVNQ